MSAVTVVSTYWPEYPEIVTSVAGRDETPGWLPSAVMRSSTPSGTGCLSVWSVHGSTNVPAIPPGQTTIAGPASSPLGP